MKFLISGWSAFKITILAARLVVPPERMELATPSAPFMNETGPEEKPPRDNGSFEDLNFERFVPAPEPYLNIQPSSRYQSSIDCILSSTARIKQALHCGRS